MLLLILAYLPNVLPDVTQMSRIAQLAVWVSFKGFNSKGC